MDASQLLLTVGLGIAASLIAIEISDWLPRLSAFIVRYHARRTPPRLACRLKEEWLADLDAYPSKIAALLFALDLIRATARIGRDHYGLQVTLKTLAIKRALDVVIASALLLFTLPVTAVTMLCFICDGKGSFFETTRFIGRHGRAFDLVRFHCRPCMSSKFSFRRFVYLTRIDELLILFSILKGDLSFVGPKAQTPEAVFGVPSYDQSVVGTGTFPIRPGITGLRQLSAMSNQNLDSEYVENLSLWLDLKILIVTCWLVLSAPIFTRQGPDSSRDSNRRR